MVVRGVYVGQSKGHQRKEACLFALIQPKQDVDSCSSEEKSAQNLAEGRAVPAALWAQSDVDLDD